MPPSDPKSSQTNPLGFDEFISIFVALTTIGAILFWSFSRQDSSWNLNKLLLYPSPSTDPATAVQLDDGSKMNAVPSPIPTPGSETSQ